MIIYNIKLKINNINFNLNKIKMGNKHPNDYQAISPFSCCDNYAEMDHDFDILSKNKWNLIISGQRDDSIRCRFDIELLPYKSFHHVLNGEFCHDMWNTCKDFRTILGLNMLDGLNIKRYKILYNSDYIAVKIQCVAGDDSDITIWIYPSNLIDKQYQIMNSIYDEIDIYCSLTQGFSIPKELIKSN